MERDVAEVLRDALALPLEVRAALIDSLISSLDQTVDAAGEEAWREEIYRRLQQIDSGAVQLIPWEEARRRLRQLSACAASLSARPDDRLERRITHDFTADHGG